MKYLKTFNESLDRVRDVDTARSPQDQIRIACKKGDLETFKRLHEEFGDSLDYSNFLAFAIQNSNNNDLIEYIVDNKLVDKDVARDMKWIITFVFIPWEKRVEQLKLIQRYIDSGRIKPAEEYRYSKKYNRYSDVIKDFGSLFNFAIDYGKKFEADYETLKKR